MHPRPPEPSAGTAQNVEQASRRGGIWGWGTGFQGCVVVTGKGFGGWDHVPLDQITEQQNWKRQKTGLGLENSFAFESQINDPQANSLQAYLTPK